jgi:hypothetical protein
LPSNLIFPRLLRTRLRDEPARDPGTLGEAEPRRWPLPRVALLVTLVSGALWALIIALLRWLFR